MWICWRLLIHQSEGWVVNMFSFDIHGQYETPLLVLCTPIREEMFLLTEARDITYTAVFDDLSQLEFEVSPVFSNGEPTPYFDYVKKRKVVHAIGLLVCHPTGERIE